MWQRALPLLSLGSEPVLVEKVLRTSVGSEYFFTKNRYYGDEGQVKFLQVL